MTRLWRSRSVVFIGLLLAFALVAAACGDSATTTTAGAPPATDAPTTATTQPPTTAPPTTEAANLKPYGGEVVIGQDQEPPTLNRFVPGGDNFIVSLIGEGYFTGVQEVDGFTLDLIPVVVTELPTVANGAVTVNADGTMTVRLTIRDDAVWSDGVPISGDDFQFTLDTTLDPDLPIDKATYEDIVDTVVGDKTFEYTLSAPTVLFEFLFDVIIPKHAVEGTDFVADWNDTMWPSAGPFMFSNWQKGEFVKLVRNPNYWKTDPETGQQLPYLDTVVHRFIPETESLVNAFRARELDIINPPPSAELIESLLALEPDGAKVEVLAGPVWEHLNFSFSPARLERNPNSANSNLAYRQAVGHLVDKRLIVDEILAGQVEPLDSFIDAFSPSLSQGSWAQYDYNPDKAMELLEQAKAELGVDEISTVFSTTSNNDARVLLSQLFVDMFEAVGIVYTNQLEDSQIFFGETLDNGKWDLGEWAWLGAPGLSGIVDIMDIFDPEAPPPDGSNYYNWGTPGSSVINDATSTFAGLRDDLNSTVDDDELVALINQMETILADDAVIHPLYQRLDPGVVWADEIGGFKHNPTSQGFPWNMEFWYRIDLM